ncbi:hypothetical protein F4604DRAFT_1686408 [Suillus subluteus]|nr:hypothetical protein F4604DRAFT_1689315 [Suillus subluteus]KAG1846618.1 hypothetical protein F4604DRAFT_1688300 [Suillus subluteus]KAG1853062.1 hypothetical protein F4604DRAFT_1686408 [Suillus subluteus]
MAVASDATWCNFLIWQLHLVQLGATSFYGSCIWCNFQIQQHQPVQHSLCLKHASASTSVFEQAASGILQAMKRAAVKIGGRTAISSVRLHLVQPGATSFYGSCIWCNFRLWQLHLVQLGATSFYGGCIWCNLVQLPFMAVASGATSRYGSKASTFIFKQQINLDHTLDYSN